MKAPFWDAMTLTIATTDGKWPPQAPANPAHVGNHDTMNTSIDLNSSDDFFIFVLGWHVHARWEELTACV